MIRCYLPPELFHGPKAQLTGKEAHHLTDVLRVRPGTVVNCFDGQGHTAQGKVLQVDRRRVSLTLSERRSISSPPFQVDLAVAIPRHGRLEGIVDQVTQLGGNALIPMTTERSVVRVTEDRFATRRARLKTIAIEACKQSGLNWLPTIHPVTPFSQIIDRFKAYDSVLIATVQGPHERLSLLFRSSPRDVLLLIGPEGDFTPEEVKQAFLSGAHPIGLGPTTLRVATACISALSTILFLLREQAP